MAKYLDTTGLQYFWGKIKAYIDAKKSEVISDISRSGETFTATRADGTTFTFTQKDDDTWVPNTVSTDGYVTAPTTQNANRVWKTDGNGVPGWRQESGGGGGGSLPSGGTIGQLLAKASGLDNDTIWKTLTALDIGALPSNADTDHALVMRDQSDTSDILTVDWDGNVDTGRDVRLHDPDEHSAPGSPPSTAHWGQSLIGYDADGNQNFYSQTGHTTGDSLYRSFVARRRVNGSDVTNGFYLYIDADGTQRVTFTTNGPAAWRTALELGSLAQKSSLAASDIPSLAASKITSGTFDAARIPTLAIADKTSGTLARARGGTGVTGRQNSTVTLSGCTAGDNHCWHNGVVATVAMSSIAVTAKLTSGSSVVLGTVPAGYRPAVAVYCVMAKGTTAHEGKLHVRITSAGELRAYNYTGGDIAAGGSIGAFTITYCI